MGKFTISFSPEDFQIIKNVAVELQADAVIGDLREHIVAVANELNPGKLLSEEMVDALVETCSKAGRAKIGELPPDSNERVSR